MEGALRDIVPFWCTGVARNASVIVITKTLKESSEISANDLRQLLGLGLHRPKTLVHFKKATKKLGILFGIEAIAIDTLNDESVFDGDTGENIDISSFLACFNYSNNFQHSKLDHRPKYAFRL